MALTEITLKDYMSKCIQLAKGGFRKVHPNPLVGCIIVKNGMVAGKGYHKVYGGDHAEIQALKKVGNNARGAILFVNLEPCNHYGKTPPCTEVIVKAGIKTVVFGMRDPNRDVIGGGCMYLESRGIEIIGPILEDQCKKLNEVYIKNVTTKLPFVALKAAQTLDGFISPLDNNSKWITNEVSREYVHKLRQQHDAILIGSNTLRIDNPRLVGNGKKTNQYYRVVLTSSWDFPLSSSIFNDDRKEWTLIVSSRGSFAKHASTAKQIIQRDIPILLIRENKAGKISMKRILHALYRRGLYSVFIEGGAHVLSQCLQEKVVDRVYTFISPKLIGKGLSTYAYMKPRSLNNSVQLHLSELKRFKDDILIEYDFK